MRRVRARWYLGLGLVMSGAAISCGSGDSAGLFTASDGGAGTVHGSSGASNQAGAHTGVAGDQSGGAFNQAGGTDQTSGAPGAGATSTDGGASGSPAGGSMGTAGKGGSTGKAGNGGGGAGGKSGGGGMSGGGAAGATGGAGAGGATAGAGGNGGVAGSAGAGAGGTSGGGGAGPVPCSDNAGCTASQYCAKSDCSLGATGTCTARPTDCTGTAETAMCGCDGFTYHDACLMHLEGVNSLAAGACPKTGVGSTNTVTCVAPSDPACTVKGGFCGLRADATACPAIQPLKGICWILPLPCPTGGGTAKAAEVCNLGPGPNSSCESECTAVKAQVRYALTANCN